MPDDVSGGRSRPRWRARPLLLTGTAAAAGVLCRRAGGPRALHGTVVLPKSGGGTVAVEIQNGRVTSVSRSSITLRSQDGFTRTYAATGSTIVVTRRDGIGSVKAGDHAGVTAVASAGTGTAIRVADLSQLGSSPGGLPAPVGPGFVPRLGGGSAASRRGALAGG